MNSPLHSMSRNGSRTPDFEDPYDSRYETKWEATPIKPFKTQDEYIYAMVEDLAEWLNNLYYLDINPDNFFEKLENGSVLCQHANNMRRVAIEYRQIHGLNEKDMAINDNDIKFQVHAKEGSFNSRDNISNFISWCRHSLYIKDVLLFESDDLVLRKNERSVILCLLEVARRGGKVGMPIPLLVQFEQDIEREINAALMERNSEFSVYSEPESEPSIEPVSPTSSATTTDVDRELESGSDADQEMDSQRSESPDIHSLNGDPNHSSSGPLRMRLGSRRSRLPKPLFHQIKPSSSQGPERFESVEQESVQEKDQSPPPQVMLEPEILKSLHERVRELINECTCPNQFPMIREAEGKYRIGELSTLIFVRILRNHVMVRVGGGWDTLEHYLDKHDPCRCKVHRSSSSNRTKHIGSDYRKSPKRRISVESPKLKSTGSFDDCDGRSVRSPSPRMKRDDSNETIASLDSNHSTEVQGGILKKPSQSGREGSPKESPKSSSQRNSLHVDKRPSQLPRRLIPPTTGTDEFLKKRREAVVSYANKRQSQSNVARSAPTSPTRRRRLSFTQTDFGEPNMQSDVYRRLALAGGREPGSTTHTRRTRSSSVNLTNTVCKSDDSSGNRSIPVSPNLRRKHRSGSLNVNIPRAETKKEVLLISRDSGGRHRLNSTSESNELGSYDRWSLRSPTDSEKSATECIAQRLKEHEKTRSLSVDRGAVRSKLSAKEHVQRMRSNSGSVSNHNSALSHATNKDDKLTAIAKSEARTKSPLQRSGSLRNPRSDRSLFKNSNRDDQASGVHTPSRRAAPGRSRSSSSSKMPRQTIPAELNAENIAKYLQGCRSSRFTPRETRSETRSCASSRASSRNSSRASSPGASRIRPRIPVPSHLKAEPQTPIRKDCLTHAQPSRIPMPIQHKRLLSAEANAASSRSHSLPDLIANVMDWYQRNIEIDGRSCTSADSVSPTPSLRTDQDSGYEDNAQKGSLLAPDESYLRKRPNRHGSIAEGSEEP